MKWNKFRLKTTTEAEDIVSSMLADLGIEGVEIEDKIPLTESDKEQMFVDILPEIEADDGVAYLSFYLEEDEDKEKVLANVKKELEEMSAYVNVGACSISLSSNPPSGPIKIPTDCPGSILLMTASVAFIPSCSS